LVEGVMHVGPGVPGALERPAAGALVHGRRQAMVGERVQDLRLDARLAHEGAGARRELGNAGDDRKRVDLRDHVHRDVRSLGLRDGQAKP
jgi:hypothetical protein